MNASSASPNSAAAPLVSSEASSFDGEARVPGDKSISHRALMLGGLAIGETRITGLLEGEDVLRTADAMRAMGAEIERLGPGEWRAAGRGVGALVEPETVLDMGNAGTGARLLMGLVAGHPIRATFTGDASLCRRPMARVTDPLKAMGARIDAREGERLPLTVTGAGHGTVDGGPLALTYEVPVPSAQVKSAVLLAGLMAAGTTTVVERVATRDHTENMLRHFGAEIELAGEADGGRRIALSGCPELRARDVEVPADISSAAFPLVAALITPGAKVTLTGVGLNSHRVGLLETLGLMGARFEIKNQRTEGGEPVGDIVAEGSKLLGVSVPAARAASMIDEYPILCVAAAMSEGETRMEGLAELRVKESDRLEAMRRGLEACGVAVEAGADWLAVRGSGGAKPTGGALIEADLDHRIAMAFLVLGMRAGAPVRIDDGAPIATSFPGFTEMMNGLGARMEAGV